MSAKEACLFLHIPKCGGTTFNRILLRQYNTESLYKVDNFGPNILKSMQQFSSLAPEYRKSVECIYGHMPFGIHEFLSQRFSYITFLREPVKRVVSHYNFVKNNPRHYLNKRLTGEDISLADYVAKKITPEVRNGMTRQISGIRDVDPVTGTGEVTESIYQKALDNIEKHFSLCGILEKFDESLVLMALYYNWHRIYYVKKKTAKASAHVALKPDAAAVEIITEHNEYDIRLYQHIRTRIHNEIKRQGADFKALHEKLKFQNKMYNATLGVLYKFFQNDTIINSKLGRSLAGIYGKYRRL